MEAKDVCSRTQLAEFVRHLRANLQEHPDEWENVDLPSFLEALSAYLDDLPGWCYNIAPDFDPEDASWAVLAVALSGASIYE